MKRSILVTAFVAATFWIAGTLAFAQHGRPASPGAGAAGTHGNSASPEGGHAGSGPTSSPSSPGSVLSHNAHLTDALTDALAKKGITVADLATTCKPFRTLGQCIAALHINHKFPGCTLADLSAAKSLGAALQGCHPQADAKAEARTATKEAKQDIQDSNS